MRECGIRGDGGIGSYLYVRNHQHLARTPGDLGWSMVCWRFAARFHFVLVPWRGTRWNARGVGKDSKTYGECFCNAVLGVGGAGRNRLTVVATQNEADT